MQISNEVRVGVMFIVGLVLLIAVIATLTQWGKDRDVKEFTIRFKQAQGLVTGATVRVSGVDVGRVSEVGLDPYTNEALVKVRILRNTDVYTNYVYTIGIGGLVGERYVAIMPVQQTPDNSGKLVYPGDEVVGLDTPDMNDLFTNANTLVTKLSAATDNINELVGNKQTQADLRAAVTNLRKTTEASAAFTQSLNQMATRNAIQVDLIVANLRGVSNDIRLVSDTLTPQLVNTQVIKNLEVAVVNITSMTRRLDASAAAVETLLGDKELAANIKDTSTSLKSASAQLDTLMTDARGAMANVTKATADLPEITRPFKEIAPDVAADIKALTASARRSSTQIEGVAGSIAGAVPILTDIQIRPEVRITSQSGTASATRTDMNLDLRTTDNMLRMGVADLSDSARINLQYGNRVRPNLWLRYGLVESRLGVGAEWTPQEDWRITGELFDPKKIDSNLLIDYRFRPFGKDWWLSGGYYNLFDQGRWGWG